MSKVALTHQVVGLQCFLDVVVVNTNRYPEQHVLGTFCNNTVETKEVRALEGLESKVIVVVITAVVDVVVEHFGVGHDDFMNFLRDEGGVLVGLGVNVLSQIGDDVREHVFGGTMEIVNTDASGKSAVVRVMRGQGCGCFSGQLIQLAGGYAIVQTLDGQFGDLAGIHPGRIQPFGQVCQFFENGVKTDVFSFSFSIYNLHGHDFFLLMFN